MKSFNSNELNAKILLFGEYSLLVGSWALSIPFDRFHGKLVWPGENILTESQEKSNNHINQFLDHIENLSAKGKLDFQIDIGKLATDVKSGLYFKSNIPEGYGLGSSGALVAALFKKYGRYSKTDPVTGSKLLKLMNFFSTLESFFHGKSSGLDPLISYLNKAILIRGENKLEIFTSYWAEKKEIGAVFLIDSGEAGETQPLVQHFREMLDEVVFKDRLNGSFIPVVNSAIDHYTNGLTGEMLKNLKEISTFQFQYFEKMIPNSVKSAWKKGIESDTYYLKLCGSGGGGMMLGFTDNFEATRQVLRNFSPIIIHHL